ncbi:MAG TPA: hypothetical protein VGA96_15945 [Fibrella sp.]
MDCSVFAKIKLLLISLLALVYSAAAQPGSARSEFSTTEYQTYDRYFERITYIGKRKDHFIVDTYLADSTLYRIDNYRVVDQGIYLGLFAVKHGPTKLLYSDGRLYLTCDYNMNVLNGPLVVYYNDGSIKRKELYRNGKLKKSMCYDTAGHELVCDALYQRAEFTGNANEFQDYLEKGLKPVLEGHPAQLVTISLLINEASQVIDVKVDAGRTDPRLTSAIRRLIQDMPRWQADRSNWKAATMDGTPVPENWVIHAQRNRSFWRVIVP